MKALIFAAGVGSRLKPFTDQHPKALASVGGITMLERTIRRVHDAGASRIVVNVHHFASQIVEFLRKNRNFGMDIVVSDESDTLLDTGGGLLKAKKLLCAEHGEPVILHNADILTDSPLGDMVEFHMRQDADATLLVSMRQSSRQLYFTENRRLAGWANLKTGETRPAEFQPSAQGYTPYAFGGVHIVRSSIFKYLEAYAAIHGPVFSITPFYIDAISRLAITGFIPQGSYMWHDIGTPDKLSDAERALSNTQICQN